MTAASANPRHLAAIVLLTTATWMGLERWLAPADAAAQPSAASPVVVLSFRAPCKPSCQREVEEAVLRLGPVGLGDIRPDGDHVNLELIDLGGVDFVALDDSLRSAGLSVQAITLRGQPRGARTNLVFDAPLPKTCCQDDPAGLAERMRHHVKEERNRSRDSHFAWIESIAIVDGPRARITAKPDATSVNLLEARDAIEAAGIVPQSLKLYGAEAQR